MEENHLPPGFRFHPSDEELITCYLARKVSNDSFTTKVIAVVDLNKCEPWDLPAKASMGEKEWYFFNLRDRKYPTGLRTNRATGAGYWKTTGKDKEIKPADNLLLIGMKKTLVFYRGRAPKGEKSNWVMHEYRLQNNHPFTPNKEEWVVCRVFEKNSSPKKSQATTSTLLPSLESPNDETNGITYEYGDNIELTNMDNFTNNSNMFDNISVHGYNGENNLNLSTNNMGNMGMSNNLPFSPCTPSLLNSNFSTNSLLLKAAILQARNYQQSEAPSTSKINYNSFVQQGFNQYGTDFSSSSMATLDPMLPPLHSQEQHINKLDPFNW